VVQTLFSNAGVFLEKYIRRARHVEVQVFGDGAGRVIEFGERECSVQRRHQKVLEEAGSPFIARHPELGREMRHAAVRLCELIQYRSAGTVEFIVDDDSASFCFLELNSRIQVEHAVTSVPFLRSHRSPFVVLNPGGIPPRHAYSARSSGLGSTSLR
jgi:urea carboxylase